MTYICVSIAVDDEERAQREARAAVEAGARLIEWRVDLVADRADLIERLVTESPAPCIVTCRLKSEGGEFDGDEAVRVRLFERLAMHARPRYLDVESAAWEGSMRERLETALSHPDQYPEHETRLILSLHDFQGRPANLYPRLARMAAEPECAVIKVAWMARSLRDNIEAFDLLSHRAKPMVAICMGRFGLMSRVLAPKFGALLTYAGATERRVTAPGQVAVATLRRRYRFDAIGPETKVYGVIGWPAEHSLGPDVHNAAFGRLEHDGVYLPMPIPPEYEHFKATVGAMIDARRLDFRGASVTMPHKSNLLRFVRESGGHVDAAAEEADAANTLVVGDDGSLAAFNTDAEATIDAITAALSIDLEQLADLRVAVLGAGGMARAATAALSRHGATVVLHARDLNKAQALAAHFAALPTPAGTPRRVVAARWEKACVSCCQVVINATPIGMSGGPAPDRSPVDFDAGLKWSGQTLVFDTVYTPEPTPLLIAARRAGMRTLGGMDLFARQAAAQLRLWTSRTVEPEWIAARARRAIAERES